MGTHDAAGPYADHSVESDPGRLSAWLSTLPGDVSVLRRVATGLVFHYRANGDVAEHGFGAERLGEIDLRYAEAMLARLRELQDVDVREPRPPQHCILGCCRDFTLLLVSMCRAHGIPARARVGFAGYFVPGWWLDHVVAEIWVAGRWRLVEAQLPDGYRDAGTGEPLAVQDVPRERFLVGVDAWRAARAGRLDPDRAVVDPGLDEPFLRSWSYLAHNLVLDLAALGRREMVLWDVWGVIDSIDPPDRALRERLDGVAEQLAAVTGADAAGEAAPGSAGAAAADRLLAEPDLQIPPTVTSISPLTGEFRRVTLRQQSATRA